MTQQRKTFKAGFTLLEISIAVAIIGLITGVITVGMEYVRDARLRKQASQLERVQTSVNLFQEKYSCYPGDCADPTSITNYTYSGNGNGFLANSWTNNENRGFWIHLSNSNLLADALQTNRAESNLQSPAPALTPSGAMSVLGDALAAQNFIVLSNTDTTGYVSTREAIYLDEKMDDGLAASGIIQTTGYGNGTTIFAVSAVTPTSTSAYSGNNKCITSGAYDGSLTGNSGRCNLVYILEK